MIRVKRAYDPPAAEDGPRILVDRLWPRGITKEALALHAWTKAIAPSTELRRAFHGGGISFQEFEWRFREELTQPEARQPLDELVELAGRVGLTLLTAHRDMDQNHALVLKQVLESHMKKGKP